MARVISSFSMSLDGFVASPTDEVGPLFDWYDNGDVVIEWPGNGMVSRTTPKSAGYLREMIGDCGAIVTGRRLFDYTDGWGGKHPAGVPIFVVTHSVPDGWPRPDLPVTFVTSGVAAAIEQAKDCAGDKTVGVAGPNVVQQCLALGLLDEVWIELVPVLLGEGIRYFDNLPPGTVTLDDPEVIEGKRVTHLRYRLTTPA
jgi:dihydrofolate reductase